MLISEFISTCYRLSFDWGPNSTKSKTIANSTLNNNNKVDNYDDDNDDDDNDDDDNDDDVAISPLEDPLLT